MLLSLAVNEWMNEWMKMLLRDTQLLRIECHNFKCCSTNDNSMGARFGAVRLRKLICFGQFSLPEYAHCTGITEKTNFWESYVRSWFPTALIRTPCQQELRSVSVISDPYLLIRCILCEKCEIKSHVLGLSPKSSNVDRWPWRLAFITLSIP